jgi:hypothetical protein
VCTFGSYVAGRVIVCELSHFGRHTTVPSGGTFWGDCDILSTESSVARELLRSVREVDD